MARNVKKATATETTATETTATETTATETTATETTATETTATETPKVKAESDYSLDDKNRAHFTAPISPLPDTAMAVNWGETIVGIKRLSKGAYIAVFEGRKGAQQSAVKGSAVAAIRDVLSVLSLSPKQWDFSKIEHAEETEAPAIVVDKPAPKGDGADIVDAFDPRNGNNEAVASSEAIAQALIDADKLLSQGESDTLTAWLSMGNQMSALDAAFDTFMPGLPKKALENRRAAWLKAHLEGNAPATFERLMGVGKSKNAPSQLRFMARFPAEVIKALGAQTPSTFQARAHEVRRFWLGLVVKAMFETLLAAPATVDADGNEVSFANLSGAEQWQSVIDTYNKTALAFAQDWIAKRVGVMNADVAAWRAKAEKALSINARPEPMAQVLLDNMAELPFMQHHLWGGSLGELAVDAMAKIMFAELAEAKKPAPAEKSGDGDGDGDGDSGSTRNGGFAALSVAEAVDHLWSILASHADYAAIVFELGIRAQNRLAEETAEAEAAQGNSDSEADAVSAE